MAAGVQCLKDLSVERSAAEIQHSEPDRSERNYRRTVAHALPCRNVRHAALNAARARWLRGRLELGAHSQTDRAGPARNDQRARAASAGDASRQLVTTVEDVRYEQLRVPLRPIETGISIDHCRGTDLAEPQIGIARRESEGGAIQTDTGQHGQAAQRRPRRA